VKPFFHLALFHLRAAIGQQPIDKSGAIRQYNEIRD
jgi:hypothetical protein